MKRMSFSLALLLGVFALLSGCSTPTMRIRSGSTLFSSLPAPDQELIRQGKVGVGFTPEMVRLALGAPDRVYTRTDASGVSEAWAYTLWSPDTRVLYYQGFVHSGLYPDGEVSEWFKVIFRDGKVVETTETHRNN